MSHRSLVKNIHMFFYTLVELCVENNNRSNKNTVIKSPSVAAH